MIDSYVLLIKKVNLKTIRKKILLQSLVFITVVISNFQEIESIQAANISFSSPVTISTSLPNQNSTKLIMPESINIQKKSNLENLEWLKEIISKARGRQIEIELEGNEKLIRSILAKVSDESYNLPSINLRKLANVTLKIGINSDLLRILVELQKPGAVPIVPVAEGFLPRNPLVHYLPELPECRSKKDISFTQENKNYMSTPSIHSLLDTTKCYAHREGFNTPRTIFENLETSGIKKLCRTSLQQQALRKEYNRLKDSLAEGIHPVNAGKKSTYVGSDKVLVKKSEGRYLVQVSDTEVKFLD